MRICFLADAGSVHAHRWISFFARAGDEVHWLSLTPFRETPEGAECHSLGPGGLNPAGVLASVLPARRLIDRIHPDLVHVHSLGSYGLLALLCTGARPLVATAWGSDVLLGQKSLLRTAVLRRIVRRSALLTCDAEHMALALRGLGAGRVEIIRFGVELDRFYPGPGVLRRD